MESADHRPPPAPERLSRTYRSERERDADIVVMAADGWRVRATHFERGRVRPLGLPVWHALSVPGKGRWVVDYER